MQEMQETQVRSPEGEGSRRAPEGGNGNLLQFSCLENSKDRGAWQATVHKVTKSQTQLSDWANGGELAIPDSPCLRHFAMWHNEDFFFFLPKKNKLGFPENWGP